MDKTSSLWVNSYLMIEFLTNALHKLYPVPEKEILELASIVSIKTLDKNELFIAQGESPKKFGLVKKGLFRYYYPDAKGKDYTKGFFSEGMFLSAYSAMVNQTPSFLSIQALEPSEIVVIPFDKWQSIYHGNPVWSNFMVKVLEMAFIAKETRERELLLLDAEKRYCAFNERYPNLEKRVKQKLIASYLGITNVALSRIRKKMNLLT